jgi:tetrapyrrole methylase family protein/MazG family protein
MGDVLFAVVNLARWLGVEPEAALQAAVDKFSHRFHYIETRAREQHRGLEGMAPAELDRLWEEAKKIPGN